MALLLLSRWFSSIESKLCRKNDSHGQGYRSQEIFPAIYSYFVNPLILDHLIERVIDVKEGFINVIPFDVFNSR